MKPTQEQVIAWARKAGFVGQAIHHDVDGFLQFAALAYEAGRKDENKACAEEAGYYAANSGPARNILDAIRARGQA